MERSIPAVRFDVRVDVIRAGDQFNDLWFRELRRPMKGCISIGKVFECTQFGLFFKAQNQRIIVTIGGRDYPLLAQRVQSLNRAGVGVFVVPDGGSDARFGTSCRCSQVVGRHRRLQFSERCHFVDLLRPLFDPTRSFGGQLMDFL